MAAYIINGDSIGYMYAGDGSKCKIFFNVRFVKDNGEKSFWQYYECDYHPLLDEKDNMIRVYEQLQIAMDEFNGR